MTALPPLGRVALYAEFTARPETAEEVASILADFAALVREESGNLVFDCHRLRGQPTRFFVYEVYTDEKAFQDHLDAPYGAPFNVRLSTLIVEPSSILTMLAPERA
jgi:quinol monooxygenase YgiN